MTKNDVILKRWNDEINKYKKLKFEEAKLLYKKALEETDEKKKKEIMNEVITGTLYIVYNYIAKNSYDLLSSSSYDLDDIINTYNEVWIRKIYAGELLKANVFSNLFTTATVNEVHRKLIYMDSDDTNKMLMVSLFEIYVYYKNSGIDFTMSDVILEFCKQRYSYPELYCDSYLREMGPLFILFENMYKKLNFDKVDGLELTNRKMNNFIKLYEEIGMFDVIRDDCSIIEDTDNLIIKKIDLQEFMKQVNLAITDEREKMVLSYRYGFVDDAPKTLEDISQELNVTRERVRQIEARTLRKLRRKKDIYKYRNYYV